MKNFGTLLLGLVIGALAMYFYCCKTDNTESLESLVKPKGLITPKEAKTLDQAFNTRHQLISDSIVKKTNGDNRSSWYALEDINNYIKYADSQATSLGYTLDGLRIYAGAHASTPKEVGLTTMFFIPTGYRTTAEGNLLPFSTRQGVGDIPGGDGLNKGSGGVPPGANYPQ
ncbi:hypothetical protein RM697_08930 [Ichthyenterobacterium sp. W332]|uniref:Lipoprotein n=1 Tax=Microcosmobacter mediterraneus TaxID=3075607 RepID=A0ABU2YKS1_9FLAO|nr:hypothetical protein [Ichthyenterobacterium sp. W332]MDT0558770.1 hypothetical protein [Ichthyenterobacterium sp. W332]